MIPGLATLQVKVGLQGDFEARFLRAQHVIASVPGASSAGDVVAGGAGGAPQRTRRNEPRA